MAVLVCLVLMVFLLQEGYGQGRPSYHIMAGRKRGENVSRNVRQVKSGAVPTSDILDRSVYIYKILNQCRNRYSVLFVTAAVQEYFPRHRIQLISYILYPVALEVMQYTCSIYRE